jgi:acyl transferase domain-containing protein
LVLSGLSLRTAGARCLGDLYSRMRDGTELHSAAPFSRWDADAAHAPAGAGNAAAPQPRVATRFGAFVSDVAAFDAAAFGISVPEAAAMDPQTRALLEHTAAAATASGRCPRQLAGAAGGVFVGAIWSEHAEALAAHGRAATASAALVVTGNGLAFMAGRLSYTFGLTGPCVPTNTACSSSLVAAHLAARSVRGHECVFAAAAGANAVLLPLGASAAMSSLQALAPDGRCKAFGAEADGYGRGEGFAVAWIEPASTAAPGAALALLAGSAVNQDGRSSGLTAPHGPSQAALVRAAMAEAGVARLDHAASHGTGWQALTGLQCGRCLLLVYRWDLQRFVWGRAGSALLLSNPTRLKPNPKPNPTKPTQP